MGVWTRIKRKVRKLKDASTVEHEPEFREPPAAPPEPPAEFEPEPESPRGAVPAADYIAGLVNEHPVVLFMKGSPQAPMCGFSARASQVLRTTGVTPFTVDVLLDPEVRQGIKDFSNWPTIPQVYVAGEFLGGSDILMEMYESGEFDKHLKEKGLLTADDA